MYHFPKSEVKTNSFITKLKVQMNVPKIRIKVLSLLLIFKTQKNQGNIKSFRN